MQISRIDVWPSPHTRNTPTPPQSVVPAACDPLGVPDLRDLLTLHAAAAGIFFSSRSIGPLVLTQVADRMDTITAPLDDAPDTGADRLIADMSTLLIRADGDEIVAAVEEGLSAPSEWLCAAEPGL